MIRGQETAPARNEGAATSLLELFLTFFKIGAFTFGGGYAMISIIEHSCVEEKKWITHDEMMNITVIAESTPGPIAINCATYVGYKQRGLLGAAATTVGVVLPSFIIILVISAFLDRFLEITWVANAFRGIKIAVGILVVDAAVKMIKKMPKLPLQWGIMICACAAMLLAEFMAVKLSTIVLMLAAAFVSLAVFLARQGFGKEAEK